MVVVVVVVVVAVVVAVLHCPACAACALMQGRGRGRKGGSREVYSTLLWGA